MSSVHSSCASMLQYVSVVEIVKEQYLQPAALTSVMMLVSWHGVQSLCCRILLKASLGCTPCTPRHTTQAQMVHRQMHDVYGRESIPLHALHALHEMAKREQREPRHVRLAGNPASRRRHISHLKRANPRKLIGCALHRRHAGFGQRVARHASQQK